MYFKYGEKELNHLKEKDKKLSDVIDTVGFIRREVDEDIFSSVVHHIVGQQISTAAQRTVWNRMKNSLGEINEITISSTSVEDLQSNGITFRKAEYIKDFAEKVRLKEFDIENLIFKSDEEIISELVKLKGIGPWTAEMILIFGLQRPDVLSYGDLAIVRGLRMLYGHREVTEQTFRKYKKRYSPYGSVASLYLWAVAGGAIPELKDKGVKAKSK
ncbi:DNA-3-methyladenine glycosylase family protein [Anaerosphaera multitolerans]|uniref:DNA-3-methyladenine glycosylase II n=1 Tax=Anaerosphaera multitolerans TaxID=2487351 RepID=A0A437S5N5_9FIRM|nr:DNA-3-methyladenine glycosylase [Anaerosphaera multitolerans]RVU54345.1 DNA-3-methyladenine glycosylase 2 family protein [Anaerosphaera multitolerans]